MSMTSPVTSAVAPSYVTGGTMYDDATMGVMSAEDILEYVRKTLGNIDGQMNDYKEIIEKRQAQADELRAAMSTLREAVEADGALKGKLKPEDYDKVMNTLTRNSHIPGVMEARETLLESYGPYTADGVYTLADGTEVVPDELGKVGVKPYDANKPNAEPNQWLKAKEFDGVMENLRSALENLNTDNEMMMMNLQKLMQQRTQVSQFASNMLKAEDEMIMGIIGNLR